MLISAFVGQNKEIGARQMWHGVRVPFAVGEFDEYSPRIRLINDRADLAALKT